MLNRFIQKLTPQVKIFCRAPEYSCKFRIKFNSLVEAIGIFKKFCYGFDWTLLVDCTNFLFATIEASVVKETRGL